VHEDTQSTTGHTHNQMRTHSMTGHAKSDAKIFTTFCEQTSTHTHTQTHTHAPSYKHTLKSTNTPLLHIPNMRTASINTGTHTSHTHYTHITHHTHTHTHTKAHKGTHHTHTHTHTHKKTHYTHTHITHTHTSHTHITHTIQRHTHTHTPA